MADSEEGVASPFSLFSRWRGPRKGSLGGGSDETVDTTAEVMTTAAEVTDTTAPAEPVATIDEALLGKWFSEATGETLEFTGDALSLFDPEQGAMVDYTRVAE